MSPGPEQTPEFSRLVARDQLGGSRISQQISANPEERAALAARLGLVSLEHLSAELEIAPLGGGLVRLSGRFEAEVTQSCVVSLEPVESLVRERFSQLYTLAPESRAGGAHEVIVDPEAEDPPEPVGARGLDLGEAVVQQLAVALDPYPRAPGARLEGGPGESQEDDEGPRTGPFAALVELLRGR